MTDYKQLCAQLVEQLDDALDFTVSSETRRHMKLLTRQARSALAEPEPAALPDDYIDPEHSGADLELLETFYTACRNEGGTADEIHLRGLHAVLARWGRSAPQPVPVSERWPEFSDCDDADQVWCWSWAIGTWRLSRIDQLIHSHWLPAHALPICKD